MSGSLKLALYIFATLVAIFIVVKVVSTLLSLLVPILIVLGVAAVLYALVNRKALGPSGRRILP